MTEDARCENSIRWVTQRLEFSCRWICSKISIDVLRSTFAWGLPAGTASSTRGPPCNRDIILADVQSKEGGAPQ